MPRTYSATSYVIVTVPFFVHSDSRNVHWPQKKIKRGLWGGWWSVFSHLEQYPELKSRELAKRKKTFSQDEREAASAAAVADSGCH